MSTPNEIEVIPSPEDSHSGSSRRSFLKGAALTGATTLAALGGFATAAAAQQHDDDDSMKSEHDHLKKGDRDILVAAEIAEALAVTTYSNIIDIAPSFKALAPDHQAYYTSALQQHLPPNLTQ